MEKVKMNEILEFDSIVTAGHDPGEVICIDGGLYTILSANASTALVRPFQEGDGFIYNTLTGECVPAS